MKYIFVENGIINGCGEVEQLDNGVLNIEIDDNIYRTYNQDPLKFVYQDGKIIDNPNYISDSQKRSNEIRYQEILEALDELDKKRFRAICENEIKDKETGETWLDYYNNEIAKLREELATLKF
ncbi:hypothetical protein IJO12_08730 [bacterium]|nr:hypothetical protein [bacterium]